MWSWHMEILVIYGSPETLDHIQFSAWKFQVNYSYVYWCLKLRPEQGGWDYGTSPLCVSAFHSGICLQSTGGLRKESDIDTSMTLIREGK